MKLRPYQLEAVRRVEAEWREHASTMIVMPTGVGKTITFAEIIRRAFPRRALVLAHREELIIQARDKIAAMTGWRVDIEMGDSRAEMNCMFGGPRVVVSTIQTQASGGDGGGRMTRFDPRIFGVVIVDEGHHAPSASYRRVLDWYTQHGNVRVLGVTATPDRADEEALGQVFESVAFDYEIQDAIRDGWLVPVTQQMVHVEGLDFSHCRTTAGDLNGADLAKVMEYESNLHRVVAPSIEIAGTRRTIVFCASVDHAERMAELFNRHRTGMAAWVCGKTPKDDRKRINADFLSGRVQVVCNCGIYTEGADFPDTSVCIMARPTKSRSLYAQMCLDAETEILTPGGWMGIDSELHTGSVIAAFRLDGSVGWETSSDVVRRFTVDDEKFVTYDNPHLSLCVTGRHDLVIRTRVGAKKQRTPWRKEMAENVLNLRRVEIPVCGVQYASGVPLSDAELRFIGLVMTDGNINPRNNQITLYQSERYPWAIEYIERTLQNCGFKFGLRVETNPTNFGERSPLHRWTVSKGKPRGRDKHLRGWEYLSDYLDKDWPDAFETLTRAQLLIVLEAMHVGDGTKHRGNWTPHTQSICTANADLANRIQSICVRRGIRCNLGVAGTDGSMIMLNYSVDREYWGLATKSSDGRPVLEITTAHHERVWCVTVPSGMIVTRRMGKVVIVGNCGRVIRPADAIAHELNDHESPEARRALIEASGKPSCLVVDFVGNSGRHKLCTSVDILGGKVSERARELAVRRLADGKPGRVDEAIDAAAAEERAEKEREAARRAKLTARAKWTASNVNPFDTMDIQPVAERGWDRGKQLTEKQAALLRKQGIEPDGLPYGQAKQLLNELFRRWDGGLCTFGQAKILRKRGLPTNVTREEAARQIDGIAAREGWKKRTA